jgi:hypothetical protein
MSLKLNPTLVTNSLIHTSLIPDAIKLNRQILDAYLQLGEQDFLKRTHYFGGRYENLYLQRECIPAIKIVLEQAEKLASRILDYPLNQLRSGFWINDMGTKTVTTEHDHDENDELLSGVYYVQVPDNSGELNIIDPYSRTLIAPQAGMFVFFAPTVRHSVAVNNSGERRISIGMNFGPVST